MARDPLTMDWSGRAAQAARELVATWLPLTCPRCGEPVDGSVPWVVGHIKSRAAYPELTWDVANWQAEHRACSDRTGHEATVEKIRRQALAEHGIDADAGVSSPADAGPTPPPLPVSLPEVTDDQEAQPTLPGMPEAPTGPPNETIRIRAGLTWDPEYLRGFEWLAEFADVPEDASAPLYMSPVPEDAVGSYGAECIEWVEAEHKIRLRWWQRLAITRQLEHREDGSLCARVVVESAPRRAGKSVRLKSVSTWRLEHGARLFGEAQLVMHTGSDIAICREIQRSAWRWAEEVAGWEVTRANGKEALETPHGDRWLVRAQTAVYGYDVTLGLVDEGWDVKPETVNDGIEPATLERSSPQLMLTSTAHRRATSLMRDKIVDALTSDDPTTLLLVWAAPPMPAGRRLRDPKVWASFADPAIWRAASPFWSDDRLTLLRSKYVAATNAPVKYGTPDPRESFITQFLNMWPITAAETSHGDPITDADEWGTLAAVRPEGPPTGAAIESWFAAGVSLALSWPVDDGKFIVSVTAHRDLAEAATALRAAGYRGRPTVGASLVDDPAVVKLRPIAGQGRTNVAIANLQRLVDERALLHDGTAHLTGQVLAVRVVAGVDGARVVSKGRADAIKAATWALAGARERGTRRRFTGMILPSGA